MFTFSKRLAMVKKLHQHSPYEVKFREALEHRNAPAFYTFTFTFCDREFTSYILTNGKLLVTVNEQNGVKEKMDDSIVDGALRLAVRHHVHDPVADVFLDDNEEVVA